MLFDEDEVIIEIIKEIDGYEIIYNPNMECIIGKLSKKKYEISLWIIRQEYEDVEARTFEFWRIKVDEGDFLGPYRALTQDTDFETRESLGQYRAEAKGYQRFVLGSKWDRDFKDYYYSIIDLRIDKTMKMRYDAWNKYYKIRLR